MRKSLLLSLPLLLGCLFAQARQISPNEAMNLASDFMNSKELQSASHSSESLTPMKAPGVNGDMASPYYVFNRGENEGFVIISGDDRAPKILGYSDKGSFDVNNLPPQLKAMMEQFEGKLQKFPNDAPVHPSWKSRSSATEIVRLNTALWNQYEPYNILAPKFDGNSAPIGCVATALAIIMKYHNYPSKAVKKIKHTWYCGEDSYSYDFGNMDIDYSLLRDEYLPDDNLSPDEERTISELLYASAAALNMQFGPLASSATEQDKPRVYREVLGFDEECQYINRECFEDGEWNSIIKEQLNNDMPVLYSARSPYDGHAFVLDGYDSEGNYHVNWGWGGYENGYYSIDGLLDFELKHGMTINMRPGEDPGKYSEKYSRQWIDNGTVLGVGMGASGGLTVNVEDIEKGLPFNVRVGYLFMPFDFGGECTIALIDQKGAIVELANGANGSDPKLRYECYVDEGWQAYGRDWNPMGILNFDNIFFNSDIREDYGIAYVTKEDGEDEWKMVKGTLDSPNYLPVIGNVPSIVRVNMLVHGDESKISYELPKDSYMYGDCTSLNINVVDGVATVYINGVLSHHATSYHPLVYSLGLSNHDYDIDIYYKRREELIDRSYEVTVPGTLQEMIAEEDKDKIGSIKISGKINTADIEAAGDLPWLLNLDLEDAIFVGDDENRENFFPKFALYTYERPFTPPFERITLPKNLKGFEQISLCSYSLEAIDIPASVEEYDHGSLSNSPFGSALSFVNVRNSIPANFNGMSPFSHSNSNLVLLVPKGFKEDYQNNELWRGQFEEIIEVSDDSPYIGEYVEDDNARYLILTDFAAIVGFKGKKVTDKIKDFVEYNGKQYPVKYAVNNKLNAPKNLIASSDASFNWNSTIINNLYSTSLNKIEGCIYHSGIHFVPGSYAPILDYGCEEMFSYKINKSKGQLIISSEREEVAIESVFINGEKAEPENNSLYVFDTSSVPEVRVEYTLFGEYPVNTIYDANFNSTLEDSDINISILVESIQLSQTEAQLKVGDSIALTANVYPEDAKDNTVTWTSDNEAVAMVDANGNVTGVSLGTATITATCGDVSTACVVTVVAIPVESIVLSQAESELKVGEWLSLSVEVLPIDAADRTVVWTSDNEGVATVDAYGTVTAVALGTATITATSGDVSATCVVTVVSTPVESIVLSQAETELKVGGWLSLSAEVLPIDATDRTVVWTSDNEAVATVDANGNVTAVAIGTATITATSGNVSATCVVTVVATLVDRIILSPDNWSGVEGESFRIEATVLPDDATDKALAWTSSDESVATVDNEGNVSVLSEGTCVITASATDGSGIIAECIITGQSGVSGLFSAEVIDVYDYNGVLIKKNADVESLKQLTPGMYIIRSGAEIKKLIIR